MKQAMVYGAILLLMYIPPFTLLKGGSPLWLLAYWTLLGLAAIAYSWVETRRWGRSG